MAKTNVKASSRRTPRKSIKVHTRKEARQKVPPFQIDGRYFSMEHKGGGKFDLSLGNLTDAGWFWDGDEDDLAGYFARLQRSQARETFAQTLSKEGITLDQLRPFIKKSIDKGNGLYMVSGDNVFWRFGEDFSENEFDSSVDALREQGAISKKQAEHVRENFWNEANGDWAKFDLFKEEFEDKYIKMMNQKLQESRSVADFMSETENVGRDITDDTLTFQSNKITDEIFRIAEQVK